jgi:hypothetical protein
MGFYDDAKLGFAGAVDAVEHFGAEHQVLATLVAGPIALAADKDAHHAADTYAEQTAASSGLTVADTDALRTNAQRAEASGQVLAPAAKKTFDQVAAKVSTGLKWLPWVAGGVAVVVGLVALAQVATSVRAVVPGAK